MEFSDSGPPLSLDELQRAEHRLKVRLPDDYRSFLLAQNGGTPKPGWFRCGADPSDVAEVSSFYSLEEMETETKIARRDYHSADFIAIGMASDTDRLLLSIERGGVYLNLPDQGDDPSDFIWLADSTQQFLTNLGYPDSTRPWMMLIDNDDIEGLRQWLDDGGNVQAQDDVVLDITALEHAAFTGRLELVQLLVARGARSRGGLFRPSAHQFALQAGHREVAEFLAKQGLGKGYRIRVLVGAACVLAAVGLSSVVSRPLWLLEKKALMAVLVVCLIVTLAIVHMYDWLREIRNNQCSRSR